MFLIRGLVSARTWLAFIHHMVGLVVAIASFTIVVTGVACGVALLPLALVGLPVLGLTTRFADGLAAMERGRFAFLLGAQIPAWPADPARRYRALLIPKRATLTGRATRGRAV